jgi:hypothetical protein
MKEKSKGHMVRVSPEDHAEIQRLIKTFKLPTPTIIGLAMASLQRDIKERNGQLCLSPEGEQRSPSNVATSASRSSGRAGNAACVTGKTRR